MTTEEKITKVKSIINSCLTYDQLLCCFSFLKNIYIVGDDDYDSLFNSYDIALAIQSKAYEMRNKDLKK